MIVATEHAAVSIDLDTGEVSMVHREDHYIHLKNDRIVQIECDSYRVNCKQYEVSAKQGASFNTPKTIISGAAQINGLVTGKGGLTLSNEQGGGQVASIVGSMKVSGDVAAGGVSLTGHTHKDSHGGQTDAPMRRPTEIFHLTFPYGDDHNTHMDPHIDPSTADYSGERITSLANAVYLRLMTPLGSWWADPTLGSRLHELERELDLSYARMLARQYAE